MFFFDFGTLAGPQPFHLIGASPEVHVRLEGRRALLRPIAGTRPRSARADEDLALARELLADPKERAEHVMLVDLARNDLGRVCEYGSVNVSEQMVIERYSHVMHIVSQVEGQLRPEFDAFDLLQATFPAGTVSGAPKIRAMQIIHELEASRAGLMPEWSVTFLTMARWTPVSPSAPWSCRIRLSISRPVPASWPIRSARRVSGNAEQSRALMPRSMPPSGRMRGPPA